MFNKYEYIIGVDGMMCNNCAHHVTESLKRIKGVKKVEVNLEEKTAKVTSSSKLNDTEVKNKIAEAGYRFINQKSV